VIVLHQFVWCNGGSLIGHKSGRRSSSKSAQFAITRRTQPLADLLLFVYEAGLPVTPLLKVFVVDGDPSVLSWIEDLLTGQGYDVSCFASAEEFTSQHQPTQLGCVLINLLALGLGGNELIRHLHETRSLLSVVITSGLVDSAVRHLDEKQIKPILIKTCEAWVLLTMIEDAIAGSLKRDRTLATNKDSKMDWAHHYRSDLPAKEKALKLSPRQRQVLSFLLSGDSLKEVAQKLALSEHTVGDYVKQIYKHFAVSSRAELSALFVSRGDP
jgi:DNA-binding NarL/FixJ family response regulator